MKTIKYDDVMAICSVAVELKVQGISLHNFLQYGRYEKEATADVPCTMFLNGVFGFFFSGKLSDYE